MSIHSRHRWVPVVALAATLLLGVTLTPPVDAEGSSALLASLRDHPRQAGLTGGCRLLAALLVVPALAVMGSAVTGRGSRAFRAGAVALYVGSWAGVAVVTQMLLLATVVAPLPDRAAAVRVADAIQGGPLWQVSAVLYLLGLLTGFLLLGVAVWRAGLGRVAGVAIGSGLVVHISVGDWFVTVVSGAVLLAGGLTAVGLRISGGPGAEPAAASADPAQRLVSDAPRAG